MKQLVSTFVLFFIFQSIHLSQEKNIVRMVIEKMSFLISVDRGQFGGFVNYTSYVNSLFILQRNAENQ